MNDRFQFAAWVFANELGVLSREQIVDWADQCIAQVDKPEWWLIEVSLTGSSDELDALIDAADDAVYARALLLMFRKWSEGATSDEQFVTCCRTIWSRASSSPRWFNDFSIRWYNDLCWIVDEFDLMEQGVFSREESLAKVKQVVEQRLSDSVQLNSRWL